MAADIQINLALILFLPAFCIVGALYWFYPRTPHGAWRRIADLCALALAAWTSVVAMHWGFRTATGVGGTLWRQVFSTLLAFGCFFGIIGAAAFIRTLLLRSRSSFPRRQES
jgi:hypothetical protein